MYDVIIIGGGPAGLNAALFLGRCRRKVLVLDSGKPRNFRTKAMHGYLSRDGIKPLEFLNIGAEELKKYDVKKMQTEVNRIDKTETGFEITNNEGEKFYSKKLLIATGIKDNIPEIEGIEEFYGKSVFHCPYCDGWEVKDKSLCVYAKGKAAFALSVSLLNWSEDVILCTDGISRLTALEREELKLLGIKIFSQKIRCLEGTDGQLERIVFVNGESIDRDALFFSAGQRQHSPLAEQLGCKFGYKSFYVTNRKQQTNVKGAYVAGDVTKDVKFVIVAAAEGARAAVAINIELQDEEKEKRLFKARSSLKTLS
ncbi:MAG: NAD(P)/FAD-dependent oxidoreductase [Bacteroidota bacterium]|nr:NAD(P)/FAD-dependent oxidoreductase [Bacteroidota bacterium]